MDARGARRAEARGEAKSLSKILRSLAHVAPGQVLSVVFEKSPHGYDYAFSVLTDDGRYLDVVLDAKTGHLISARTR
ncbi:MAG: PepSY domain-containing protein [Pseudomonadota bacterium]|nr:PepSY domain-containing protein [Pseudomonadota bacterium]